MPFDPVAMTAPAIRAESVGAQAPPTTARRHEKRRPLRAAAGAVGKDGGARPPLPSSVRRVSVARPMKQAPPGRHRGGEGRAPRRCRGRCRSGRPRRRGGKGGAAAPPAKLTPTTGPASCPAPVAACAPRR
ncbi:hypothetical protein [Lysobacter enzymogenes]|uniref:hypothetical protein n=1 Tax=Lysobacter enzymogenes TaxID=69 RepID=UPI00374829FD